jgi:hypothetical protein
VLAAPNRTYAELLIFTLELLVGTSNPSGTAGKGVVRAEASHAQRMTCNWSENETHVLPVLHVDIIHVLRQRIPIVHAVIKSEPVLGSVVVRQRGDCGLLAGRRKSIGVSASRG